MPILLVLFLFLINSCSEDKTKGTINIEGKWCVTNIDLPPDKEKILILLALSGGYPKFNIDNKQIVMLDGKGDTSNSDTISYESYTLSGKQYIKLEGGEIGEIRSMRDGIILDFDEFKYSMKQCE